PGQYKKLIIDGISYQAFLENLKDTKDSIMSFGSTSPPPVIPEETLPGDLTNNDDALLSEITTHFVDRGFQPSLVDSFLARSSCLEIKTNEEIMLDFLEEREQMDPTIFVGIEGNEGVELGEDKKLLVKWGLTEETADRLRSSVHGPIWVQQVLKHWLLDWIYNSWNTSIQMSFSTVFYNLQFQRNEWHSYERYDGPQMFASSYEEIVTIGKDSLISCNTKVTNPTDSNHKAFFHATNYQSAKSISKNGIYLTCYRNYLDFGKNQSFYLNPSLDNAIDLIKRRDGFNGIVVYWVDMEKVKSLVYRDLTTDENLWRELSNPREILTAFNRSNGEDSWQNLAELCKNLVTLARWFEPIRHLQLA
ncbi:5306_t:CDS:2, partial [Acaulospora morrowiae]